ncbi:MAG TPA: hypothetical protein VHG93_01710 [Longimicrobium sp.]|nr:hypothetical protein [Longimicrobium sp.]
MTALRSALRPAAALAAALGLAGWASCHGRTPEAAAVPCAPAEGQLAAGARSDGLAGEFRLTLAATAGPRAGESTAGTLRLRAFGGRPVPVPPAAGVRYPLFGGADVDLDAVGAVAPGAVDAVDAARPGVLVMEWPRPDAPAGTREITLRLGVDANHGDQVRFDGAFTALTVTAMSADRFTGRWESGGEHRAAGYFCADRL